MILIQIKQILNYCELYCNFSTGSSQADPKDPMADPKDPMADPMDNITSKIN